jgi:hypothetical protein
MIIFIQSSTSVQSILLALLVTLLLLCALAAYLTPLLKGELTPRPLSWIGWALMMGISLFSQVMEKGWQWNQAGLTLSVIGCVVTAIFSLKHGVIVWWDWLCLLLGALCVIVYLSTKNAWLTTIMAIVADFIVALPTQHNAYIDPKKERSIAWHFGAMAYLVNCISCMGSAWLYAAFPLYLLCMNSSMVYLTTRRVFKQVH